MILIGNIDDKSFGKIKLWELKVENASLWNSLPDDKMTNLNENRITELGNSHVGEGVGIQAQDVGKA